MARKTLSAPTFQCGRCLSWWWERLWVRWNTTKVAVGAEYQNPVRIWNLATKGSAVGFALQVAPASLDSTVESVGLVVRRNIDRDHADQGNLEGALPGTACILQLAADKNVSIALTPAPRNDYQHMVLRVKGDGAVRVVIEWVVQ